MDKNNYVTFTIHFLVQQCTLSINIMTELSRYVRLLITAVTPFLPLLRFVINGQTGTFNLPLYRSTYFLLLYITKTGCDIINAQYVYYQTTSLHSTVVIAELLLHYNIKSLQLYPSFLSSLTYKISIKEKRGTK